jgi:putative acetyltransferase
VNQTPYLIRATRPEDAADIAAYMADPAVFGDLLQLPHPTEAQWRERLSAPRAGNDLSLVAEQGGRVVASAGLFNQRAQLRRQHASALGISVATPAQGQGIGRALMAALTDYADRWGQILRIELSVFADNTRAIALYERFGFVREGLHRCHALRDGVYVDTLSMARLHPNTPRWVQPHQAG